MRSLWTLFGFWLFAAAVQAQTTWYVPDDFPAGIQAALSDPAVVDNDVIIIKPGMYAENINFLGKAVTLKSELGPAVTVIDGGLAGSTVTFAAGEGLGSILEGFTITNGSGTYYPDFDEFNGGGVLCDGASPTIVGNVIAGNEIRDIGAGVFCYNSAALITGNVISDNIAHGSGAGIYSYISSPTISGNEFLRNTSDRFGGGLRCRFSTIIVGGNVFRDNSAVLDGGGICFASSSSGLIGGNEISNNVTGDDGGGIFCEDSSPEIKDNIVTGNVAEDDGGGIFTYLVSSQVVNNVVSGNTAVDEGGGIQFVASDAAVVNNTVCDNTAAKGGGIACYNSTLTVCNTILWEDEAAIGSELWIVFAPSVLTISHSILGNGSESVFVEAGCLLNSGAGLMDADPQLKDIAAGDFHLAYTSPCVNSGDNAAAALPEEDFEGDPRISGAKIDMGADEYSYHLYHLGTPAPGAEISFRIAGVPGKPVTLFLGGGVQDPPEPIQYGDLYLVLPIKGRWPLGAAPADGIAVWDVQLPGNLQPGTELPFQALVGPLGHPASRLTNLMVLEIE